MSRIHYRHWRSALPQVGVEGALLAAMPAPMLLVGMGTAEIPLWALIVSILTAAACGACALLLFRRPAAGKVFGSLAALGAFAIALPYLLTNPLAALTGLVMLIAAGFVLTGFKARIDRQVRTHSVDRCLQRARSAAMLLPVIVILAMVIRPGRDILTLAVIAASALIGQTLFVHWRWKSKSHPIRRCLGLLAGLVFAGLTLFTFHSGHLRTSVLVIDILILFILPKSAPYREKRDNWWETFLDHPARMLLITFLALCAAGTLLLLIPGATAKGPIAFVDAAFTSVSAVCVTGLIVLDTPGDFALPGQMLILLLIQLGGLGIMSITTVALNAMGRRLSLRSERLITQMTATDQDDLFASLGLILKFTFAAEAIGAVILTGLFHLSGDPWSQALWRGVFTAVSAFCNAGFALQSDSLIPYQFHPLTLHTVGMLIICGGLAPATSLLLPRWTRGKPIPVAARIALKTTVVLLIAGTGVILAFEWNGVLAGMPVWHKLHNAWFQSVTLRTAGFNSVDISRVISPTFLIMLFFMFIGGSPGGTAGGVKTTTIGVLAATFWANIMGREQVIVHNRRIRAGIINRAVTIIVSGGFVWFFIVLMLEATQQIGARDIIFEATSAIGTVGLSTGATMYLDPIGKVIIMLAMFAGRVGPMTLFMLLSEDRSGPGASCPDAKISLT